MKKSLMIAICFFLYFTAFAQSNVNMDQVQRIVEHYGYGSMNVNDFINNPVEAEYIIKNKLIDVNNDNKPLLAFADCSGESPLKDDYLKIGRLLLENGANVNVADNSGETSIFIAIHRNFVEFVELLINFKIDLKHLNGHNESALSYACKKNTNIQIIEKLAATKTGIDGVKGENYTPLSLALDYKKNDFVQILIKNGAKSNFIDSDENTLLYKAVQQKNFELAKAFAADKKIVNQLCGKSYKLSCLSKAIKNNDFEIVKLLLENGANPNIKEYDSFTPMFEAAECENPKIAELMVQYGGNINFKNKNKETPFYKAVACSNSEVVEIFKNYKPDYSVKNTYGYSLFIGMAQNSVPHRVTDISDADLGIHGKGLKEEIVKLLIENGCNINEQTEDGLTPLLIASRCELDMPNNVLILLKYGANPNQIGYRGFTPLSVSFGKPSTMTALLDAGADPFYVLSDGKNVYDNYLNQQIFNKESSLCIQILYSRFPEIAANTNIYGAVLSGNIELTKKLLSSCNNIDAPDEKGNYLLFSAVLADCKDVVSLILNRKPDLYLANKNWKRLTPLHVAVRNCSYGITELLLKAGADPNHSITTGFDEVESSLLAASKNYNKNAMPEDKAKLIELLVKYGADINARGENNTTDFLSVIPAISAETFEYLISKGADIFVADNTGRCAYTLVENDSKKFEIIKKIYDKKYLNKTAKVIKNTELKNAKDLGGFRICTIPQGSLVKIVDYNGRIYDYDDVQECAVKVEFIDSDKTKRDGYCFAGDLKF